MDLRNPSILHAMAALGREVEQPGPMGRAYAESLVVLAVTELVRHHSTLAGARSRPRMIFPRAVSGESSVTSRRT
jgi:hypothetical protein